MQTKVRWKMDSWEWFSTGYALVIEFSLFLLLKEFFGPSPQVAGITLVITFAAFIGMNGLRGDQ